MSKSDLLGTGSAFSNARRNFGTDEEMTRFGEELRQAQLSACVVVSRSAYLALWSDHAPRIGSAPYVLINGERRFRSALHVGLEALDFVVRDDLAASRTDFIDHLLAENLEREDFDVIERARGVQQLVDICAEEGREHGAKSRAAERLGKSPSWVTNQLVLLELPDEIQRMLSAGELPERDGRALARTAKDRPDADAAALLDLLKQNKEQEAQVKAVQKEILRANQDSVPARVAAEPGPATGPSPSAAGAAVATAQTARLLSADKSRGPEAPSETSAPADDPVKPAPVAPMTPAVPRVSHTPAAQPVREEQEPSGAIPSQARGTDTGPLPWQDPRAVYDAIWANMSAKHREELTMLLIESHQER
ncbi:ParB/RepB/Spo0J family partition protein [Streptomyces sp. NPDC090022]|uniref:ParB/RepB/Spo0J family partition protein n=1 Tax=Streptomyces sp. NPDC090022 TaxID=3365920 RepID=UPI0038119A7E